MLLIYVLLIIIQCFLLIMGWNVTKTSKIMWFCVKKIHSKRIYTGKTSFTQGSCHILNRHSFSPHLLREQENNKHNCVSRVCLSCWCMCWFCNRGLWSRVKLRLWRAWSCCCCLCCLFWKVTTSSESNMLFLWFHWLMILRYYGTCSKTWYHYSTHPRDMVIQWCYFMN